MRIKHGLALLHGASAPWRYGAAILFVLLALAARSLVDPYLGDRQPYPFFLAAVALAAWFGGRGPALVAVLFSFLAAEFFFMEPRQNLALLLKAHDIIGMASFLFASLIITLAIHLARTQAGELVEERERLSVTLSSIGDAVIATDTEGKVSFMNPVASELTGWSAEEAKGEPLMDVFRIVNEQTREPAENPVSKVLREGLVVGLANHTLLISRDGTERAIADSGAPIRDRGGRMMGVVLVFRDVSADRAASERERRLTKHTALRAEVAAMLTQPDVSVQQTLQRCTESIMRHLPAAFARIWTLNTGTQVLELQASAGMYTHLDGPHARVPVGKFKIGLIAQELKPHLTNDVLHDPRISNPEWARREGMVAFAGYPLVVDGQVLGVMALFAREQLPDDTLDALSSVANLVAQGIQRKRAEEALRERERQLGEELASMVTLHEVATRFVRARGQRAFLDDILEAAISIAHADMGNMELYDAQKKALEIVAHRGFPEAWLEFFKNVDTANHAAYGEAAAKRQRVVIEDVTTSPIFAGTPALEVQLRAGVRAVQSTPILSRSGEFLGVLSTHFRRPHRPDERELQRLDVLTRQAADFLEHDRAQQALQASETALKAAQQQLQEYASGLEKKVAERTTQLRQTIAELEAFSYSLSHDMRAPLRAIQSFAQLVLADYGEKLDPVGAEFVQKIINAAQRLDRLIQDVLAFTRLARQEITVAPVNVGTLLQDIIRERPEFQPPRVEVIIEHPLLPMLGHDASLTQCITNLLDNAVKFVARNVKPRVRIYSESIDDHVRLWFEDNGIGIDREAQQRLFKMFQRTHGDSYEGTGIGLAIVKQAVGRMGGDVGVESEPGKGSRFWLQLPKG